MYLAAASHLVDWTVPSNLTRVGQDIPAGSGFAEVRAINAILGGISSMMVSVICLEGGITSWPALVGGMMSGLDILSTIQSRVMMPDTFMVLLEQIAFFFAMKSWNAAKRKSRATPFLWMVLAGVASGSAVATKWTSYAVVVIISSISFFGIPPFLTHGGMAWPTVLSFYAAAASTYYFLFDLYLSWCNRSGEHDNFTSTPFRASLIGSGAAAHTEPMDPWMKVYEYNKLMWMYSRGIRGDTKSEPSWIDWILNQRTTIYVVEKHEATSRRVTTIVNPAVSLTISASLLTFTLALFLYVRYLRRKGSNYQALRKTLQSGSVYVFAWIGSMLPTLAVFRCGPIYQYLPALFFATLLTAQNLELLTPKLKVAVSIFVILAIAAAFAVWSPWVYFTEISQTHHSRLLAMEGWMQ
uniref:Dolichyl-phosphate-mannose--protein mannosyltransferase n=1 Tax=Rhodosorus marinus TaxID=101924 RepID=A0A7S0BTU8_9RHOD